MHGQLVRELRVMLVSDTGTVDWDWDSGLGQWTVDWDSGLGQLKSPISMSPVCSLQCSLHPPRSFMFDHLCLCDDSTAAEYLIIITILKL